MAIKRVSVSGLPNANKAELKNTDEYPKTSFLVSIKQGAEFLNTSKQLAYKHLYDALSSQIADQFNIAGNLGSATKPIYIDSTKKFKATTEDVGGDKTESYGTTFTPIYMKDGELVSANVDVGNCSYDDHTCTPIYMHNGTLTPATSLIGSAYRPIYMDKGTLKETSANVGGLIDRSSEGFGTTFKPIYMSAGVLCEGNISNANVGGCSYVNHTCTPIYMQAGQLIPATSTIGSETKLIYMDNGTLKESDKDVGDVDHGIYMSGGQFYQCSPSVTPIGFDKFEPVATVVIAANGSGDTATEVSNTDILRVANLSVYNGNKGGADGIVDFYIEHGGWYMIYAETQQTNASGVLVRTNKDTSWTFWNSTVCKKFPKIAYYNKTVKSSMCALINVTDNCVIGVHPNIIAKEDDPFYFFNASLKWTADISSIVTTNSGWRQETDGSWTYPYNREAVFDKPRKGSTDKQYYKVVSSGTGSFANPFESLNEVLNWWKSASVSYDKQKEYVLTTPTYFVYKNGKKTKTVGSGSTRKTYTVDRLCACGFKYKSGNLRSYDLAKSPSPLWSSKDTVYLIKCSRKDDDDEE